VPAFSSPSDLSDKELQIATFSLLIEALRSLFSLFLSVRTQTRYSDRARSLSSGNQPFWSRSYLIAHVGSQWKNYLGRN
jgi:hypothetical protein